MKKELTPQDMGRLSIKKQKSNPNYLKVRQRVLKKANDVRTRLAIKRAINYLRKNGFKVVGMIISK